MMRSLFTVFIIVFLSPLKAQGQQGEIVEYSFFSKDGDWCSNFLNLYSNGKFYWAGPCENDIAVSSGKWKIKKKRLYLIGEDSLQVYPKSKVVLQEGDNEKIKFTVKDRYKKSFKNFGVTLIKPNGNQTPYWTDSTGTFSVERGQYAGFCLDYQSRSPMAEVLSKIDTLKIYAFEDKTAEVIISVDFPAFISLDRGITLHNFGKATYLLKNGNLYSRKGELLYGRQTNNK